MNFEDWIGAVGFNIHLFPQQQSVPLILRPPAQELFLATLNAGVTADSGIDHCCETLAHLAIDQWEQSLVRESFHRGQKVGEDAKEYARNLQRPAERAFRVPPLNRVTNWVSLQLRVNVQPQIIAVKLHAVKTNDLNQLVEDATWKRQERLLRPPSQAFNPTRPHWTSSHRTPKAGEPYYFLSYPPPNGFRPFMQIPGKLEGSNP
ncbi:hypothetical protein TSMEX_000781 [Taenia solium]|eukprot:TsM_001048100 transcript=TsM_001048100 gene=TsM_001048100